MVLKEESIPTFPSPHAPRRNFSPHDKPQEGAPGGHRVQPMAAGERQTETGEARAERPGNRRHREGARDSEMAAGQYCSNICIRFHAQSLTSV